MKTIALFILLAHAAFATPAEVRKALTDRGLAPATPQAIRATAFLVDHSPESVRRLPDGPLLSYRPLSSEEITLTPDQIAQLLTILSDRRTYMPDMVKLCVPSYELGVTFASTHGYTEAVFCLTCDMIAVTANGGEKHYVADIDLGHNALLSFFQDLFPKNQTLQHIPPNKPEKRFSREIAIEWAESCIPNDPLLKRVKALKPEETTEDMIERLATKATAAFRGPDTKPSKRKSR